MFAFLASHWAEVFADADYPDPCASAPFLSSRSSRVHCGGFSLSCDTGRRDRLGLRRRAVR